MSDATQKEAKAGMYVNKKYNKASLEFLT